MKIEVRGMNHYVADRELMNTDISAARSFEEHTDDCDCYPIRGCGDLAIKVSAENVHLNGNYEVTVSLTKDEIANLARIAFRKERFGDVVAALTERGRKIPSEPESPDLSALHLFPDRSDP